MWNEALVFPAEGCEPFPGGQHSEEAIVRVVIVFYDHPGSGVTTMASESRDGREQQITFSATLMTLCILFLATIQPQGWCIPAYSQLLLGKKTPACYSIGYFTWV